MFFLVDAMRHGAHGALDDRLLSVPWGFDPEDIAVPVRWWHGTDDQTVPFAEVEAMIETIPDSSVSLVPDAGHLVLATAADDIVSALIAR